MKSLLLLFVLAVTYTAVNGQKVDPKWGEKVEKMIEECSKIHKAHLEEVKRTLSTQLKPKTAASECALDCVAAKSGLKKNGKLDKAELLKRFNIKKAADKIKAQKVLVTCEKAAPGKCSVGTAFVNCFYEIGKVLPDTKLMDRKTYYLKNLRYVVYVPKWYEYVYKD